MMAIHSVYGNILQCNYVDAVINTVNCVGVMGKGIAKEFKGAYPDNFKLYSKACKANIVKPGLMFIYDFRVDDKTRYIINFPTKLHWRNPSKIEYITKGLKDLIDLIKIYNITSIAIPPLGCGNGGLNWATVKPLITDAFSELPNVEVYIFEPYLKLLNKHYDSIPSSAIYIGRGSLMGNPFVIGRDGDRLEVIKKYQDYLFNEILNKNIAIINFIKNLKPDDQLLCYCSPSPCHGDVIRYIWCLFKNGDISL